MQKQLFSQQFISVLVGISVGAGIVFSLPAQAEKSSSSQQNRVSVAFQPPAGEGMPNRTAGGASRTGPSVCPSLPPDKAQLTALVPALQKPDAIASNLTGLTTETHPTLYFFVPAVAAEEAVFSLKDEKDRDVYQTTIPLSGQTGIVSVKLPSDAPLQAGQSYRWSFGLVCPGQPSQQQPEVVFVTGEIRRVEADASLQSQIQQLTPLEQAAVYAQNGIWFNSVGILASLRQSQPDDSMLARKWEELLKSVELQAVARQPFINP